MERVEQFFLANDVDNAHKEPTLLSLIGGKTYTLLRDLLAPEKLATKSFQQTVTTIQEHMSPKPLEIAERFRFYQRNQHEGEGIFVLLTELRKLATHCNFGGNLYEVLRERLACGLQNMQIQKRLLSEAKLKYSKAVEIAVAMETAMRDTSEYSELNSNQVPRVDMLTEHNKPTQAKPATTLIVPLWWKHTYDRCTVVFTRTRFATTVKNRAMFSGFVVPDSKASRSK